MRKRITVDQLAIGMFVDEFCGAWIDHPFWRSKLLITDPADLQRIIDAQIGELWIDTAKGDDVVIAAADATLGLAVVEPSRRAGRRAPPQTHRLR